MASLNFLVALAIFAVALPSTLATDYVVGDDKGWSLNFDYQAWAAGREFHVGDKLIFKYSQGAHNVFKVNGTAFQQCVPPAGAEALTTGNDIIPLAAPGRKWYICGVGKHCASGNMKLAITVMPQVESPAMAPSPSPMTSAAREISASTSSLLMGLMFGIVLMVAV